MKTDARLLWLKDHPTLDELTANSIRIEDIAHSLSNLCRFIGSSPIFYSVAEHSILTMRMLEFLGVKLTSKLKLGALLHDANEAYIGDIVRPVREWLIDQEGRRVDGGFSLTWLASHITKLIETAFKLQLTPSEKEIIHIADNRILDAEKLTFYGYTIGISKEILAAIQPWSKKIRFYDPQVVRRLFLKEFQDVYRRHVAEM